MVKDIESLAISRDKRVEILAKYGNILTSVWETDYSLQKNIIDVEKTQSFIVKELHAKMDYDKRLSTAFGASGKSVRGKQGGLSIFPADICKKLVLLYSEEKDTVLDPCAGHNSRMQITWQLGRNYIGYDVSKEFMEFNRFVKTTLLGKNPDRPRLFRESPATITLREQSSEKMVEEDTSIDFVFTSPPYWDIEFYGEELEQLGYRKTYGQFLNGLSKVINESYRVLKPNKYCVYNVNDFRKDGKFYCYHADLIELALGAGFRLHDIIILRWNASLGSCFATQIIERKSTAKAHEYLLVFKKV